MEWNPCPRYLVVAIHGQKSRVFKDHHHSVSDCTDRLLLAKLSVYPPAPLAYQMAEFVGHLYACALPAKKHIKPGV